MSAPSGLISVAEALDKVLGSIARPVEIENVPVSQALGRTLAQDLSALRHQPPFRASAMDGYALRADEAQSIPARLKVVGTSAAGHTFEGRLNAGEAVRIFTGAPLPDDADAIVIQENTERHGHEVVILEPIQPGKHIRARGLDFEEGEKLLEAGQVLTSFRLALAASMGHATLPVRRRPRVAILATGDELVAPGTAPGSDQIVASNTLALMGMVVKAGGEVIDLGIAPDALSALEERVAMARQKSADLLVTLGGASVGDHDLVMPALQRQGMTLNFWRVALRPGKPMIHGLLDSMILLGLPGNPVSSFVCGILFVVPAIRTLLGQPDSGADSAETALLGSDLPENGERQDYLRATLKRNPHGLPLAVPYPIQDSSMQKIFAYSQALILRVPHAPAAKTGDLCRVLKLDEY